MTVIKIAVKMRFKLASAGISGTEDLARRAGGQVQTLGCIAAPYCFRALLGVSAAEPLLAS